MRPENILAWSVNVELGAPPPSQPPFDQFGNPIVDIAANIKEWKREFEAQQAEKKIQDGIFRQEKGGDGPKIRGSKADIEAYIKDWKGASGRELAKRQENEVVSQNPQLHLNIPKPKPSAPDIQAHFNQIRKQNFEATERERMLRQRKVLFPHTLPKEEDQKAESKLFRIPQMRRKPVLRNNGEDTATRLTQRKPVPNANDKDTTLPRALHPRTLLLRNGETKQVGQTKTIENQASYAERVRALGYPEALCPLGTPKPMKGLGVDCTGAKINDDRQLRHENRKLEKGSDGDGDEAEEEIEEATPKMMALKGEFRTLKVGVKRV